MDQWKGKVALVTGAGSGIGAAIVEHLLHHQVIVVALDKNEDNTKNLVERLSKDHGCTSVYPLKANLVEEEDILKAFKWIDDTLGGCDILVNNAGVASTSRLIDGDSSEWRMVLDVNVLAVSICTREFLRSLERRNCDRGHVLMINSVAAHTVQYGKGGMYYASKHAVKALAMCLRKELAEKGNSIKVTCISPGRTRTEMVGPGSVLLSPTDVSTAVIQSLSASPVTQICDIIITPVPTLHTVY